MDIGTYEQFHGGNLREANVLVALGRLGARIDELERAFSKYKREEPAVIEQENTVIPRNYMSCTDFSDHYKFISRIGLYALVKKNAEFFVGYVVYMGRLMFIDPERVMYMYGTGGVTSSRLLNQFRNWHRRQGGVKSIDE